MRALLLTLVCIQAQGASRDSEDAMANLLLAMNSAGRASNVQRARPASMGNQFSGEDKFRSRDGNIAVWNEIQRNVVDSITTGPKKWQDKFDKWGTKAGEIRTGVQGGLRDIDIAFRGAPGDKSRVDGSSGFVDSPFARPEIFFWTELFQPTLSEEQVNKIKAGVSQGLDEIYVAISPGGKNSDEAQKFRDGTYRQTLPAEDWALFQPLLYTDRYVTDFDGTPLIQGSTNQEEAWKVKDKLDAEKAKNAKD
jgi:hypothetical protein